jgi:hypothetical protein
VRTSRARGAAKQQAEYESPCRSQVYQWSRVGRLKRARFPSLKGGGHTFGGGAGAGALACTAGRLLCDTYLSARCAVPLRNGLQVLGLHFSCSACALLCSLRRPLRPMGLPDIAVLLLQASNCRLSGNSTQQMAPCGED